MKILFGVGIVAIVAWVAVFAVWGISSISFVIIRRKNKKFITNDFLCTGDVRAGRVSSISSESDTEYKTGKTRFLTDMAIEQAIEAKKNSSGYLEPIVMVKLTPKGIIPLWFDEQRAKDYRGQRVLGEFVDVIGEQKDEECKERCAGRSDRNGASE